jgi:hypothetical protein
LGIAIGVSEEVLDQLISNRPPEEAVIDILGYWMKNYYKPSCEDFAEVLKEIGLDELASNLLKGIYYTAVPVYQCIRLDLAIV